MSRAKLWLLLIMAVTFGVYAPSLANGFAYDDYSVVRVPRGEDRGPNEFVAELQPLGRYFSVSYSEAHGGLGRGFRPITLLSFAIVHRLTRSANPPPDGPVAPAWGQHLLNIILHCCAVWLTFEFLALFLGCGLGALLGAAVFGLHALRSDPVISIVGRAEIMGFVFGMAALLLYVSGLRRRGSGRSWRLALCAGSLFLAVCSKESAAPWIVMIPLVVVALRLRAGVELPEALPSLRAQVLPWAFGLLLPLVVFLVMLISIWSNLTQEYSPAYESNPLWFCSALDRVVNGVIILAYGLYKVFLPIHLAHDYSESVFRLAEGLADYRVFVAAAVLLGGATVGIVCARRHPLPFLAVAVFFGFTFSTSNIVFPVETIFGERLFYTPALALSILLAWLYEWSTAPSARRGVLIAACVWGVVCCGLIVKRDFDWRDNKTLFFADAQAQPNSIRLQMTLMSHLRDGDPALWKRKIDQAHAINPKSLGPLRELAFFFISVGQFDEALRYARLGLASDRPDLQDHTAQLLGLEATALEEKGQFADAERSLRSAVKSSEPDPRIVDHRTRLKLGSFLRRRGRLQDARRELETVRRSSPGFLPVWDELMFNAHAAGDDADLQRLMAEGRARFPGAPQFALQAAILAQRRGDLRRSAQMFDQSIRFLPRVAGTAEYFDFYLRLLMQQRRFDEARGVLAEYLRKVGLPPGQKRRFVRMAKGLGMGPPR